MTNREYLLTTIMEECSEIQKVCSKILRFGETNIKPGTSDVNIRRLFEEIYDLELVVNKYIQEYAYGDPAVLSELTKFITKNDNSKKVEYINKKIERFEEYKLRSQILGYLDIDEDIETEKK
jgi:hypothetical protein